MYHDRRNGTYVYSSRTGWHYQNELWVSEHFAVFGHFPFLLPIIVFYHDKGSLYLVFGFRVYHLQHNCMIPVHGCSPRFTNIIYPPIQTRFNNQSS
ncbi:hypothetical protein BDV40DRAFT_109951 [Aspergillus tamarii]|uniref:Uncharacterized protein n=1 Tax=Aspergillus tamarii TaxID=41984 RepID=A0A5N6V0Q9_ASPTM|nr:hypothetical protein BDV40DRAFT_109951 [Aspergillus tamarii]